MKVFGKEKDYAAFEGLLEETLESQSWKPSVGCVLRGQPYGGEEWVRRTAEQLGLESTLRAPHRPRKVAPSK